MIYKDIDVDDVICIDTLDTADTSTQLIGVAIYARFKLNNGEYSCQLVSARIKIVPKENPQS